MKEWRVEGAGWMIQMLGVGCTVREARARAATIEERADERTLAARALTAASAPSFMTRSAAMRADADVRAFL